MAATPSAAIISGSTTTIHGGIFNLNVIPEDRRESDPPKLPSKHTSNPTTTELSPPTEKKPFHCTKKRVIIFVVVVIVILAAIIGGVVGGVVKKKMAPAVVPAVLPNPSVLPNPLVLIGEPPQPGMILIKNNESMPVQVAVSNATSTNGSPTFYTIASGSTENWIRSGNETAFINGGGPGRVAIAIAIVEPGSYIVQTLDYADPNIDNVFNSVSDKIGVKNNLATAIQVKVIANTNVNGSEGFFNILPGATETWTRSGLETIFIKYSSSDILLTYLGIPGQDLQVNGQSKSPAPIFRYVKNVEPTQMRVLNEQSYAINVKISSAKSTNGSEQFYMIQPIQSEIWARNGTEVIYVNGPNGTAIGVYYGNPSYTLVVDNTVSLKT